MIIDRRSTAPPLVLIPASRAAGSTCDPAVDALAEHFRVITFSLADEPQSAAVRSRRVGFDNYVDQIVAVLDASADSTRGRSAASRSAALVALRFAARTRSGSTALVLASTPGPGWHLRPRHDSTRAAVAFGPCSWPKRRCALRRKLGARCRDAARTRRGSRCVRLRTLCTRPFRSRGWPTRAADRGIDVAQRLRARHGADARRHRRATARSCRAVGGHSALRRLIAGARSRACSSEPGISGTLTRPRAFARRRAPRSSTGTAAQHAAA